MLSFVLLRVRFPNLQRPFRSPLGVPGAVLAGVLAIVTLIVLFVVDPVYRKVVIGAAIWFALGLLYFAVWGRRRLVYAPEEQFAARCADPDRVSS
jgi:ethanolamine permease